MFRQSIVKATRPATRAFATTARAMGAGDTGAVRPTGQTDAFQKREKAQEDYAIRQREKEKLLELKKRLEKSQDHIKKLEQDIDEYTKSQGGEQKS
ncbi:hypothetical protein VC83_05171 [Pseudogymnoascus destructans]|nr:uncharacterized protein VC83_05171 [Pseudogymnoascus destructans]OAF58536.1 hypothetical protein VC83_05171 [Pseudogymnoascus destructans]